MKFFISLSFISLVGFGVYSLLSLNKKKTKKYKESNRQALKITLIVVVILLFLFGLAMYKSAMAPDVWCTTVHVTQSRPPLALKSANDYFLQGNYDYDRGNCVMAIVDYAKSIKLNPDYLQAYNNRAYTYMRMQDYQNALPDLDKALSLNPNYIQALMNRGDIHNYYYAIDRLSAVADYKKVIALGGTQETSVCGHLFMALHNGWNLGTILDFPRLIFSGCN